jgi:hypothetical protein
MRQTRFSIGRLRRAERESKSRGQAHALHRSTVRKGVEERRKAQDADMSVVVEVLLRAAFPKGATSDDGSAMVSREPSREHLRRARRVSIDEGRHGSSPSIDARGLRCPIRLGGPVAAPHRKERSPGNEEAKGIHGPVGRATPIAAQVQDDPDNGARALALALSKN